MLKIARCACTLLDTFVVNINLQKIYAQKLQGTLEIERRLALAVIK